MCVCVCVYALSSIKTGPFREKNIPNRLRAMGF